MFKKLRQVLHYCTTSVHHSLHLAQKFQVFTGFYFCCNFRYFMAKAVLRYSHGTITRKNTMSFCCRLGPPLPPPPPPNLQPPALKRDGRVRERERGAPWLYQLSWRGVGGGEDTKERQQRAGLFHYYIPSAGYSRTSCSFCGIWREEEVCYHYSYRYICGRGDKHCGTLGI
jgi:hypothetical protein